MLVVLFTVLLAGCRVESRLVVEVAEEGSGRVQLRVRADEEAVDALGGDVAGQLRVTDLAESGWEIEIETVEEDAADDTAVEVVASKLFGTPEQLTDVVKELSGEVGPFRKFRLTRNRSLFETEFEFSGVVNLRNGVGATLLDPGDDDVAVPLEGEDVDIRDLRRFLSREANDAFEIQVSLALPGGGSSNAPATDAGDPVWTPSVGERVELDATSTRLDTARVALVVIGAVLAFLAFGVGTGWHFVRQRRDPERPKDVPTDVEGW